MTLRSTILFVALGFTSTYGQEIEVSRQHPPIGPSPNRSIDDSRVTYFVSPSGDDASDGRTRATAWATLQKAADAVQPGEMVLALKGVHRKPFHIAKIGRSDAWITFLAEPGAEIRGSTLRTDWQRLAGEQSIYFIERPTLIEGYQKAETPLASRTEQVFVNDRLLRQASDFAMLKPRGVFFVNDTEKRLYVCLQGGKDPNKEQTEVTGLTYAIAIGGPPNLNFWVETRIGLENQAAYIRIDGFRIRHIGNWARMAAVQIKGLCENIVIENCDVQWANYFGLSVSGQNIWSKNENRWIRHNPAHVSIRHSIASNCGVQGIASNGAGHLTFEYNLLDNNNYKGASPWHEGGGIKTGFNGSHITIRGNVARNNDNHGLWIDYGATDCVIENNFVLNSVAGAILNEVTPQPPGIYPPEGPERISPVLDASEIRKLEQTGTIIRNNVCVATRTPGGGGIILSNGNDCRVYNNITSRNDGYGYGLNGSPNREDTGGQVRNRVYANISFQDAAAAQASLPSSDAKGRTFDNLFQDNLFIQPRSTKPFVIQGEPAGPEEWAKLNEGKVDTVTDKSVFRNPDRFDFTLTDTELATRIGFNSTAMRLDWSEYYVDDKKAEQTRQKREYAPLDLSAVLNHGLVDTKGGDGKGGWTDQGVNDMRKFPNGNATIDGIPFHLGTKNRGAVLLDSRLVKPGGTAKGAAIRIGRTFDDLNFLYAAVSTDATAVEPGKPDAAANAEQARFTVYYENRTQIDIPVQLGNHILDWRVDPTWEQHTRLNNHGVYTAWQGPSGQIGTVSSYCMRWTNPNPNLKIVGVTVAKSAMKNDHAFFLLGLTGGNRPASGGGPISLHVSFDGDVDGVDSSGEVIEAGGYNRMSFDAGTFVPGIKGKAFCPLIPLSMTTPVDFPLSGQGAISLWLKADPWNTPARIAQIAAADYRTVMTPFEAWGAKGIYSPWGLSFRIEGANYEHLNLEVLTSGTPGKFAVTPWVKPDVWFNVLMTWHPSPDKKAHTERLVYLDGREIDRTTFPGTPSLIGDSLSIGVPKNGGQPWRGAMDELTIWKDYLSVNEVKALLSAAAPKVTLEPAALFTQRDGLPNTAAKLAAGKAVNVVFLGGSITEGGGSPKGYVHFVTEWLKEHYPKSKVNVINSGISGTGSDFGAGRYDRDVIAHHPDLVFIEFCVNDGDSDKTAAMERMVHKTWLTNPQVDIVIFYTLAKYHLPFYKEGNLPPSASAHERVAAFYGIPSLGTGFHVASKVIGGEVPWSGFANDGCHPNSEGYALFDEVFAQALPVLLKDGPVKPHALGKSITTGLVVYPSPIVVKPLEPTSGFVTAKGETAKKIHPLPIPSTHWINEPAFRSQGGEILWRLSWLPSDACRKVDPTLGVDRLLWEGNDMAWFEGDFCFTAPGPNKQGLYRPHAQNAQLGIARSEAGLLRFIAPETGRYALKISSGPWSTWMSDDDEVGLNVLKFAKKGGAGESLAFQKEVKRAVNGLNIAAETTLLAGEELVFCPGSTSSWGGVWKELMIVVGLLESGLPQDTQPEREIK